MLSSSVFPTALAGLLSPPVLFFALGAVAVAVRSNLAIPRELATGLSLYLVLAIGFKGGSQLAQSGLTADALTAIAGGLALGIVTPVIAFGLLARILRLGTLDSAAVAAHYGSVSIVTFVTAQAFLNHMDVPYGGHMVAVMALMEAPGILVGLLLGLVLTGRSREPLAQGMSSRPSLMGALHETLVGGGILLLLGSFAIGLVTGNPGQEALGVVVNDLFPGVLALFLLDMGITAARRFREFLTLGARLLAFALVMPIIGGALGIATAAALGLTVGDATLLATLAASASYIAAPAAVRLALPQANQSLPITLALGVTFPFNLLIGIPVYYWVAQAVISV